MGLTTAKEIADHFAKQDPNEQFIWQAFSRDDIESWSGDVKLTESEWEMVVRLYDKEPATYEDFGIEYLIEIARERVCNV